MKFVQAMKAKEELLKQQQELRLSKPKRPSSSRPRPGGVTLKLLIDEGLLLPGAAVLNLEYRGLQEAGDLLADGRIQWKGGFCGKSDELEGACGPEHAWHNIINYSIDCAVTAHCIAFGFADSTFDSPSAFSIFVKRMVNPTRKADDGWKTVKYCGK